MFKDWWRNKYFFKFRSQTVLLPGKPVEEEFPYLAHAQMFTVQTLLNSQSHASSSSRADSRVFVGPVSFLFFLFLRWG